MIYRINSHLPEMVDQFQLFFRFKDLSRNFYFIKTKLRSYLGLWANSLCGDYSSISKPNNYDYD